MSPESMTHAVKKVQDSGNKNVFLTERGSMFGYQDLIVDFRGIPVMKQFAPVILDVTHSLQQPNQNSGVTGGSSLARLSKLTKSKISIPSNGA